MSQLFRVRARWLVWWWYVEVAATLISSSSSRRRQTETHALQTGAIFSPPSPQAADSMIYICRNNVRIGDTDTGFTTSSGNAMVVCLEHVEDYLQMRKRAIIL